MLYERIDKILLIEQLTIVKSISCEGISGVFNY